MIKIFYGDDRLAARREMKHAFADHDYEVIEGADLTPEDLPSIFRGNSLFADQRYILIRDFFANARVLDLLPDYVDTPHQIIFIEPKLEQRSAAVKKLKNLPAQVEFREFKTAQPDSKIVFDIYRTAKHSGPRAVQLLQSVQASESPDRYFATFATLAQNDFKAHPGAKEKRVLAALSQLDYDLHQVSKAEDSKQPWLLLQAFLLRFSSL